MSTPADNARVSLVLPRTVSLLERAATRIARRAALPLRSVGQRATSFADRIVGGWLEGRRTPVGVEAVPSRAAARVGAPMVMTRPWYELPSEVQAAQAMVRRRPAAPAPLVVPEAAPPPATLLESPAERGAQISRTQLEAPPAEAAPATGSPIPATPPPAETASTVAAELAASSAKVAAAERTVTEAVRRLEQAQPAPRAPESRAPEGRAPVAQPPVAAASTSSVVSDAPRAREATVAELLVAVAPPAYLPEPVSSAPTVNAFTRAFHHSEWVSARLAAAPGNGPGNTPGNMIESPVVSAAPVRSTGYVFVAPAAEPITVERARAAEPRAVAPAAETAAVETTSSLAPPSVAAEEVRAQAHVPPAVAPQTFAPQTLAPQTLATEAFAAQAFAAQAFATQAFAPSAPAPLFEAALPDLRAPAATPPAAARIESFLARLAGVQASYDSQALPLFGDTTASAPGQAFSSLVTRAPGRSLIEIVDERPVARPSVSPADAPRHVVQPAAQSERAETLAAAVEPVRAISAPARVFLEPPRPAPVAEAWRPGNLAARAERLGVSQELRAHRVWGEAAPERAAFSQSVSSARAASLDSTVYSYVAAAPAARATQVSPARPSAATTPMAAAPGAVWSVAPQGPASTVRFLDRLAGIEVARAVSPMSLAQAGTPVRTAELVNLTTSEPARRVERQQTIASAAMRTGGVAVRAEQLAGVVGVRAAGLSLDFVDPAKVPALTSGRASAELSYLWPQLSHLSGGSQAQQPVSREEWDLVATFPSTATASQVRAARQAQAWSGVVAAPAQARHAAAPAMTVFAPSAARASFSTAATRAAERVGQNVATTATASAAAPGLEHASVSQPVSDARSAVAARAPFTQAPAEWVAPTIKSDRGSLPGGRMPRGSFTWSRASEFSPPGSREFAPVTSAPPAPSDPSAVAPLWQTAPARPVLVPELASADSTGMPVGQRGEAGGSLNKPARAHTVAETQRLASVAPFLELFRGGLSPVPPSRAAAEFIAPQTPLVQVANPISAAPPPVQSMVQALQKSAPAAGGDDRVSLADLTLIAMASATQQVAAAEEGGRPAASAAAPAAAGGKAAAAGNGKGGAAPPDLDDLARKVFKELQRLLDLARERSGSSWES